VAFKFLRSLKWLSKKVLQQTRVICFFRKSSSLVNRGSKSLLRVVASLVLQLWTVVGDGQWFALVFGYGKAREKYLLQSKKHGKARPQI